MRAYRLPPWRGYKAFGETQKTRTFAATHNPTGETDMTRFLKTLDRVANFSGAIVLTAVLLAAAPSLTSMISASHLIGA